MEEQNIPTKEEYRERVFPILVSKGVKPPEKDGPEEDRMYQRWLRGWKRLNEQKDGR